MNQNIFDDPCAKKNENAKPELKHATKHATKSELKPATKPATKPELKPATKAELKSELKSDLGAKIKEQIAMAKDEIISEIKAELKANFETQLADAKADFETQLAAAKVDFENQLAAAKADFETQLAAAKVDFENQLAKNGTPPDFNQPKHQKQFVKTINKDNLSNLISVSSALSKYKTISRINYEHVQSDYHNFKETVDESDVNYDSLSTLFKMKLKATQEIYNARNSDENTIREMLLKNSHCMEKVLANCLKANNRTKLQQILFDYLSEMKPDHVLDTKNSKENYKILIESIEHFNAKS